MKRQFHEDCYIFLEIIVYRISQNKTPMVNTPPFFTKNWAFFLFLGKKIQKICIKKGWVSNPFPFLGRVGLFDKGCFILRDKVSIFREKLRNVQARKPRHVLFSFRSCLNHFDICIHTINGWSDRWAHVCVALKP